MQKGEPSDAVALLWIVACGGFVWKLAQLPWVLLRGNRRTVPIKAARPRENERGEKLDAPVAWLLPRVFVPFPLGRYAPFTRIQRTADKSGSQEVNDWEMRAAE